MKTNLKLDVVKLNFAAKKIRVLIHPHRHKIAELLYEHEKLSVTQIYEMTKMLLTEASHHLGRLRKYGIVKKVIQRQNRIYSINKDVFETIFEASEKIGNRD